MSTFDYSSEYRPAAPVCQVYLGQSGNETRLGPLTALIDTGADLPIVPMRHLLAVNAQIVSRGRARGLWGEGRMVRVYAVALQLNGLRFSALRVLGDEEGDEIIIGRFVLNRVKMILDGPAAVTDIIVIT